MAGIYIHIPFCRQKCNYCDFYKTDRLIYFNEYLVALKKEILQQKSYLQNKKIDTVYFGGGTPSVLNESDISSIISWLHKYFTISPYAEITFEANPDDLNKNYLQILKKSGINRLSIGIQSFQDDHLKMMNRRHNADQAFASVVNAREAGFNNISIDLIYGIPGSTLREWNDNLQITFKLPAVHLSAYHMTFHKGTVFYDLLKSRQLKELSENESYYQYKALTDETSAAGFEQYEISNFAKNGTYSKHNRAYWSGKPYLGLGPSAHSFNGCSRRWNWSDIIKYIELINQGEITYKEEQLTLNNRYNEYILTNLRTKWGVSSLIIKKNFGADIADYFIKTVKKSISKKNIVHKNEIYTLTSEGLFVSDNIITKLMII